MKISVFPADEAGMSQLLAFLKREDVYVRHISQGGVYLPARQAPIENIYFDQDPGPEPSRIMTWCFTVFYVEAPVAAPIKGDVPNG